MDGGFCPIIQILLYVGEYRSLAIVNGTYGILKNLPGTYLTISTITGDHS